MTEEDKNNPYRLVMMAFRSPWILMDEVKFHCRHQKVKSLSRYIRTALEKENARNSKLPSKVDQ